MEEQISCIADYLREQSSTVLISGCRFETPFHLLRISVKCRHDAYQRLKGSTNRNWIDLLVQPPSLHKARHLFFAGFLTVLL